MKGKKNAWVPVLAPLLSIVIDQDSPESTDGSTIWNGPRNGNWQEPWRCALAKTGRILYSKGWRVSAGVSMAHNSYLPREVTPISMSSFRRERSTMRSFTSGVCLKVRRKRFL